MKIIRTFFRVIRPVPLVACLMMYALGVGILDFNGEAISIQAYLLGQSWVIFLQLSMTFLSSYFSRNTAGKLCNTEVKPKADPPDHDRDFNSKVYQWGSLASFSGAAVTGVLLIVYELMSLQVVILMLLLIIVVFTWSMPPLSLEHTGYGEFFTAFWLVLLIPAFAFTLQNGNNVRLILLILSPLFFLHLAMQLALELRSYKEYPSKTAGNYMESLGWRIGIHTHNVSIIASFLCFGVAYFWGLPKFIQYIGVSILPLGVFQILQMRRILLGGRPLWNLINLTAYSLFFLTSYLFTYAYWVQ